MDAHRQLYLNPAYQDHQNGHETDRSATSNSNYHADISQVNSEADLETFDNSVPGIQRVMARVNSDIEPEPDQFEQYDPGTKETAEEYEKFNRDNEIQPEADQVNSVQDASISQPEPATAQALETVEAAEGQSQTQSQKSLASSQPQEVENQLDSELASTGLCYGFLDENNNSNVSNTNSNNNIALASHHGSEMAADDLASSINILEIKDSYAGDNFTSSPMRSGPGLMPPIFRGRSLFFRMSK